MDLVRHLKEVELAAEAVLSDRAEAVALDRQRNLGREASRALEREARSDWRGSAAPAWLAVGGTNCFLQVENGAARDMLKKGKKSLSLDSAYGAER